MTLTDDQRQGLREWIKANQLMSHPSGRISGFVLALLDENESLRGQVGRLRILDAQSDLRRAADTLEIITSSQQALADKGTGDE